VQLTILSDMSDDEAILRFLRPFAQLQDGIPPVALEQAASAFRFASPSQALAARNDDSGLALAGARSSSAVRVLEFSMPTAEDGEAETLSIEFVGSRLIGHASSGGLSGASCRTPKGQATADRLDDGTFEFDEFPAGPFCLLVDIHGHEVQTDWIVQA
jgi:hypothetical protein